MRLLTSLMIATLTVLMLSACHKDPTDLDRFRAVYSGEFSGIRNAEDYTGFVAAGMESDGTFFLSLSRVDNLALKQDALDITGLTQGNERVILKVENEVQVRYYVITGGDVICNRYDLPDAGEGLLVIDWSDFEQNNRLTGTLDVQVVDSRTRPNANCSVSGDTLIFENISFSVELE